MAAGPGQRRPPQDRGDTIGGRQGERVQCLTGAILHGAFTPELPVPDRQLPIEIPKAGKSSDINAIRGGGRPHGEVRAGHIPVQAAAGVGKVGQVIAGPAGQLFQVKRGEFRHGPGWYPGPVGPRGRQNLRT